jgi:hypothetical protein
MSGIGAALSQVFLQILIENVGNDEMRKNAGFVVHQIIAGFFMVVLFMVGSSEWWFSGNATPEFTADRLFSDNGVSKWCSALVLGELLLWDIPCGLLISSLRDPLMLTHHVVMALVAYIGAFRVPSYYCLFFFGVVELSSIPLVVVDMFHPQKGLPALLANPFLSSLNEACRIAFALLFLLVRAIYFPYIVFVWMVPDILELLPVSNMQWELRAVLLSAVGLTLLQLYWATLIIKQVAKLLSGGDKTVTTKKTK